MGAHDAPVITTVLSTAVDPRPTFNRALATATKTIAAVRPDQQADPTPCGNGTVRELLEHLVRSLNRITVLGRGGDPLAGDGWVDMSRDGWVRSWTDARVSYKTVWSDDRALAHADALANFVTELTRLTRDLATAIGFEPTWDDEVVAFAAASGCCCA